MDTNISNGLNKNIIIGIIALVFIAGIMLIISQMQISQPPAVTKIDTAAMARNISELSALDAEMSLISQDNAISSEVDNTLNEVGETIETTSLNNDEQNLNNISNDLTNVSGDEAVSKELDQDLGDAAL